MSVTVEFAVILSCLAIFVACGAAVLAVAAGACVVSVADASGAAVCGSLEEAAPSVFSGTFWAFSLPAWLSSAED